MAKFNPKKEKTGFDTGEIAGRTTSAAGKYTDAELLRRVTLANLLFESNYYQSSDTIMRQIEELVKVTDPNDITNLIMECRFDQKLRHTPLWLTLLLQEYHSHPVADLLAKISTRPDMLMDILGMLKVRKGSFKPIPKGIKKGLARAFSKYDEYQLSKYKKTNLEISLVDVVNLVHPRPTQDNAEALKKLVDGTLGPADTWESKLSAGADKKETFEKMINSGKLGALATLRNLRNMKESGVSRATIIKAISQVNSTMLTPLNFLAALRYAPEYVAQLDDAMARCFAHYKIPGTTIVAVDVSGSMNQLRSAKGEFTGMDVAFVLAALSTYIFEDVILVFTAGNDYSYRGRHVVWTNSRGLGIFNNVSDIVGSLGGGGIFTYQLCEWLKNEGLSKDADRLVVISDSQDIDRHRGVMKKPDTRPYDTSYIIDISTNTHGIKTGNWTAEINGWSDKLFHYIYAVEKGWKF